MSKIHQYRRYAALFPGSFQFYKDLAATRLLMWSQIGKIIVVLGRFFTAT